MRATILIIAFGLLFLPCFQSIGQNAPQNFYHLTVKHGLNDPVVNAMCQDKHGYMWFATLGALNRFNGTSIRRFTNVPGDITTPYNQVPYSMACDKNGRLWIGYTHGMLEYNYETSDFRRIPVLQDTSIWVIEPIDDGRLFLGTSVGLLCYDPVTNKIEDLVSKADTISYRLMRDRARGGLHFKSGTLYVGSYQSVVVYDIKTKKATEISIPGMKGIGNRLCIDAVGHLWVSNHQNFQLLRFDLQSGIVENMSSLLTDEPVNQLTTATDMSAQGNNIWIITSLKGLVQYDIVKKKAIHHRYISRLPNSLSSDNLRTIYVSSDGTVWVSSIVGIDYFHPAQNFFEIIFPLPRTENFQYARGVCEDTSGNLWFGTTDGFSKLNPGLNKYSVWRNEAGKMNKVYSNSIRSIISDNSNSIWVVTGGGVNRYYPYTGKMDFLDEQDSLPRGFYFSASKDRSGAIWFGTRDNDGFYYHSPLDDKIHSIASHPVLKRFRGFGGRYVFEDSRGRLWLGFNGSGLGMYDKKNGLTRHWINNDVKSDSIIAGNLVVDIKEDRDGIVWISSFGGITGIDVENRVRYLFNEKNGLTSNNAGPIAIDADNRLWIGTANGLMLLDSSRNHFTYFNEEDGLPSLNFSEHPGYIDRNGRIMMPTTNGFIRFDSRKIKPKNESFNFFIADVRVFDKILPVNFNTANKNVLKLKHAENFFTVDFEALNYLNPGKIWYAYQLEGVDKDWNYTQDPRAIYTSVPGGDYILHYKATTDVNNWNLPEKTLSIHVDTVFYKTWWFYFLIVSFILLAIYWIYRSRLNNQVQLHKLHSKAQLLEKEKTLVMYESLKQQLNPHFLFNSLTSLSGLIETDQRMAGNFLEQMSKIYRYILKNRDSEVVSLREEINFVQVYIDLQKTRFKNGLQVSIHTDPEEYHRKIAPVTLQNLIENAIKHNIIDNDTPLNIEIYTEGNYLVVKNNLQRKHVVETSNKQGLYNLRSLYEYLSGQPVIIEDDGNSFIVKVPLI